MAAPYAPTHSREGKGRVTLDDALGEPHRLRKTAKQRALDIVLGVPLHRQRPWLAVPRLGGFDHAIGGPGGGDERRREIADRLVVAAVYARLESRERAMQQRARLDPHGVTGPRIGVIDGAAPFTGQVLVQGPSQCDVQDLDAAADREDREAAGACGCDQTELHRVPRAIGLAELRVRPGAVARGAHVFPSGQHEAVNPIERGACLLGSRIGGTIRGTSPARASARTYALFKATRSRPASVRSGAVTATTRVIGAPARGRRATGTAGC